MVSVLAHDAFRGSRKSRLLSGKNDWQQCPRLSWCRFWFTRTDLEPVGNARIDSRYKLDAVIEDVDGLIGL